MQTIASDKEIFGKVRTILRMLIVQFLAGMALNVVGVAEAGDSTTKKILSYSVGIIHVVNGIGLLVVGIMLFMIARNATGQVKAKLTYGFYDILGAFFFGVLTSAVQPLTELFSFLMAVFFLLSFMTYGSLYMHLKAANVSD